jgi:uncharacterized protein
VPSTTDPASPSGQGLARDWSSASLPVRLALLHAGLLLFGVGIALMVNSRIGLGPWDAFHVGIHRLSGISIGSASILVGLVIVVATARIGVRLGAGTFLNMLLVGIFIDLFLPLVPDAPDWRWGLGYYALAIPMCGIATGMYIAPGLGPGPRDGLMIGISRRSGWPVHRVRTLLELFVLLCGWLMGGRIGLGTVIFAVCIGPAAHLGLQLFGVLPRGPRAPRGTRLLSILAVPGLLAYGRSRARRKAARARLRARRRRETR